MLFFELLPRFVLAKYNPALAATDLSIATYLFPAGKTPCGKSSVNSVGLLYGCLL